MAQATLVEMQIRDAQRLIDRLVGEGIPVTAAGWLKETESGDWYLYLATPFVGPEEGKTAAYHRVNAVVRELQKGEFWVDPFEIKAIGPHDPVAKDMVAHRTHAAHRGSRIPTRFGGYRLGDLPIEEAFIYPVPESSEETAGVTAG